MRSVVLIFLMFFAVPALAQQEPECRGKKGFKLGDGAYGCLLEIVDSSMSRTQSRSLNGGKIHSSSQTAAGLIVAIFGDYDKSRRVTDSRLRQICKTFRGDVKAAMGGKSYRKVVVRMYWPRIAAPKTRFAGQKNAIAIFRVNNGPLSQSAYMSQKCTGIGHFGKRPS